MKRKKITRHICTYYRLQAILWLYIYLSIPQEMQHPLEFQQSNPSYFQTDSRHYCILYRSPRKHYEQASH
ncbi:hypothetical protein HanRHA438_Chr03g0135121 [Helianthus annuus]|nr:hypothetical protein HanRHA438_Chr03g0135121 [Helianthus annuus]